MILSFLLSLFLSSHVSAFDWTLSASNTYSAFKTTLQVPPLPIKPPSGDATYFYWPGLQTNQNAPNYNPIGFGVLQPVLTFGPACTPNQPSGASVYRGWHVSGQYVNPGGTVAGHTGCLGGNMMDVAPGDSLIMTMVLNGNVWEQTVTRQGVPCTGVGSGSNTAQGCQVTFSIDMNGQGQNRAELVLELYYQAVVTSPVTFSDIVLTVKSKEPASSTAFCTPQSRLQKTETCSGMSLSADGLTCTIQQCVFAATASPPTITVPNALTSSLGPTPSDSGASPSSAPGTMTGMGANNTQISPDQIVAPPPPDMMVPGITMVANATTASAFPSNFVPFSSASGNSQTSSKGASLGADPSASQNQGTPSSNAPDSAVSASSTSQPPTGSNKTVLIAVGVCGALLALGAIAFVTCRRGSSSGKKQEPMNWNGDEDVKKHSPTAISSYQPPVVSVHNADFYAPPVPPLPVMIAPENGVYMPPVLIAPLDSDSSNVQHQHHQHHQHHSQHNHHFNHSNHLRAHLDSSNSRTDMGHVASSTGLLAVPDVAAVSNTSRYSRRSSNAEPYHGERRPSSSSNSRTGQDVPNPTPSPTVDISVRGSSRTGRDPERTSNHRSSRSGSNASRVAGGGGSRPTSASGRGGGVEGVLSSSGNGRAGSSNSRSSVFISERGSSRNNGDGEE